MKVRIWSDSLVVGLQLKPPLRMATITKRLHISGLTPSLTPEDLSKRFSSFGTVKAIDGFGAFFHHSLMCTI